MAGGGTFGWETLAPHGGGRQLQDPARSHTVAAKVRTGGSTQGFVYLDIFSADTGWTIIVLDHELKVVTQGFGRRKQDAWEMCESELKGRGLLSRT